MDARVVPASAPRDPQIPEDVFRVEYESAHDGRPDWALLRPPRKGRVWAVMVHGHGSHGDQIYTRPDVRGSWLAAFERAGVGVLSPNLRDNGWMAPPAVRDLRDLLQWTREHHGAGRFIFFSGSMGGTANLVYAALHPEDVGAAAALGAATDMAAYHDWCMRHESGVQREVGLAIASAYGGPPAAAPALYRRHSPLFSAGRLTMPLFLSHGECDELMPVGQMRAMAEALRQNAAATWLEIRGGGHDSPLFTEAAIGWFEEMVEKLRAMS